MNELSGDARSVYTMRLPTDCQTMSRPVTLLTERPVFSTQWQAALGALDVAAIVRAPSELAIAVADGGAIVVDGASEAFDEDELLTAIGFARAAGLVAAVHDPSSDLGATTYDVLVELTAGLVSSGADAVERIANAIVRRLDRGRERRFEYVTVAPREGELLIVLGDGRAVFARRPVSSSDDMSDIVAIALSESANSAELELSSGGRAVITTADVVPTEIPSLNGVQSIAIDGARLGRRLRALRLEAGLTQADLARRTGIHRPNIARVEAGRHTPALETLARLANAIGVPTTRVLSDD